MRTTFVIPDDLYRQVKRAAHDQERTVTSFVEQALRAALDRRATPTGRAPYRVDVVHGDGLQPGVDLADTASILDVMEGR